jgi:hypothetical protein
MKNRRRGLVKELLPAMQLQQPVKAKRTVWPMVEDLRPLLPSQDLALAMALVIRNYPPPVYLRCSSCRHSSLEKRLGFRFHNHDLSAGPFDPTLLMLELVQPHQRGVEA